MRRQFYSARAAGDGLPDGHLLFDLVTGDRDTFKTRLDPMGARFRPAKPWIDAHGDDSANRCIGNWTVSEQVPEHLRVQVVFDLADDNAAKIYRKHKDGVLDGCSVGFDPIKYHMTEEPDGEKTLVYDEYWVLEGSSCAVGSNPTALVVRSAGMKRGDFRAAAPGKIVQFSGETPYDALVNHAGFDLDDEAAFLATFGEGAKAANIAQLEDYWSRFSAAKRAFVKHSVGAQNAQPVQNARAPQPNADASRLDDHPAAARRDVATVSAAPPGTLSQTTEAPSMKTHDQRSHHRYMIGDKLRAASDHMEAIGMHSKEEHRAFHRKGAEGCMDDASHLARMINESIAEGHEDAPADAQLTASMIRSVPDALKTDAAIVAKWEACQRAALPHAGQTFRQAAELLGAKTPEDLVTAARAQEDIVSAHKKMLSQNRSAEKDKEVKERADLVASLVSGPVGLSPARECEMLGLDSADPKRERKAVDQLGRIAGPWSLERIRKYEVQIVGNMPEVQTRATELRGADGKPVPQNFGSSAPGPRSKDDIGANPTANDFGAALADAAKRMKISPEKLRSAQDFGRR